MAKASKEDKENALKGIQAAFSQSVTPAAVRWVHGTQSPTLVAMMKSDQQLKPSGQLKTEGKAIFCGENSSGVLRINTIGISGTGLKECGGAIAYAEGGIGRHDEIGLVCLMAPEKVIPDFSKLIEGWNIKLESKGVDNIFEAYSNQLALYNFHRYFGILSNLEPKLFEELIVPQINAIIEKLGEAKRLDIIAKIFTPILEAAGSKQGEYNQEDKNMMQFLYPLIFGAINIDLVETAPVHALRSYRKKAFKVKGSAIPGEHAYQGPLKLEVDLQFVFAPQKAVADVQGYLAIKVVKNVLVCNFESLRLAKVFQAFIEKKRAPKIFEL